MAARARPSLIALVLVLACGVPLAPGCAGPVADYGADHAEEIERWRAERDARLRSEGGWLTLAGLFWLEPGENRFGSDPKNDIVFPEGKAPARAGSFVLEGDEVRVEAAPDAGITLDGEPVERRVLRSDVAGPPDVLRLGELSFYAIERAGRHGIRLKDRTSPVRLGFTGIDYFPVDPRFRVVADFVPYAEPREVSISTVIGTQEKMLAPGYVRFDLPEDTVTLEPVVSGLGDEQYWFIFKDGTSGEETYAAGRYLYADRERDGKVVLDFNKAYNPPCVFTPYATCPLPPRQNWITARIEAGEKMYGGAH